MSDGLSLKKTINTLKRYTTEIWIPVHVACFMHFISVNTGISNSVSLEM